MNAKEKAEELFNKMVATYDITSDFCYDSTAKQCASIAVDEILNVLFQHHEIDYWKEVKKKIEKL